MSARANAIEIFKAAVAAVQPEQLMPAHLFIEGNILHIFNQQLSLNRLPGIYIIGAGKASAAMAKSVENILGELIDDGVVVTKYEHAVVLERITCLEAAHPVPDEAGLEATQKTIELLGSVKENDIVICLVSGGASSLWIDLPQGASLNDVQQTFELLLKSGASIDEMNAVRKHLSGIKGGQLIKYAPKAKWFSFIISDVPGDDLSVIASGPTVADNCSFGDVATILEKYNLTGLLPASILTHIDKGCNAAIGETLKKDDPVFKNVQNQIIGSNTIALQAAAAKAIRLGYQLAVVNGGMQGDAASLGRELVNTCNNYKGNIPACFLYGGETTVKVTGNGKGGRNQHMALSALLAMDSFLENTPSNQLTFLAAGTDGTDGPTDAAGAIADGTVLPAAHKKHLIIQDYLENNDAYNFFEQTDGLFKTGATQTNVMDLVVVIIDNWLVDN